MKQEVLSKMVETTKAITNYSKRKDRQLTTLFLRESTKEWGGWRGAEEERVVFFLMTLFERERACACAQAGGR